MKKQFKLLVPISAFATICHAQTFSPTVLGSAGGVNETDKVSVEWTLGEPAVQTITTNDQIITQGFHQSSLKVISIQNSDEHLAALYNISVAPNPVKNILTASVQSEKDSKIHLSLADINGKDILKTEINSGESSRDIDMSALAPGIYFLHAWDAGGTLIKTFKISKIQ